MITDSYADCLDELRRRDLLPDAPVAVYLAGSLIRGWGNETSDLDIYVICKHDWPSGKVTEVVPVALRPASIAVQATYVGERRWDIEYWLDTQVDQVFDKVGWTTFQTDPAAVELLTYKEIGFLERVTYALPLDGTDWLATRRRQVEDSALRSILISRSLHDADVHTEDAVGQLNNGDLEAAVLSTMMSFNCAVDALVTSHGQFGRNDKWQAHRYRLANPTIMPFDEYWSVVTMRGYEPADPGRWVRDVLLKCRRISLEVVI